MVKGRAGKRKSEGKGRKVTEGRGKKTRDWGGRKEAELMEKGGRQVVEWRKRE